jgi:hypothetical protein
VEHTGRYHGGLVFYGKDENAMDRFARIAASTLEDYGHPVERQTVMSPRGARIAASCYMVRLTLEKADDADDYAPRRTRDESDSGGDSDNSPHRLIIELCPVDPGYDDLDLSELLMVVMLYRLVDMYDVSCIEWLEPETRLSLDQFLNAFTNVSASMVRGRQEVANLADPRFDPIVPADPSFAVQYDEIYGSRGKIGREIKISEPIADYDGLVPLSDQEQLSLAFRTDPHPNELTPEDVDSNDIQRLATWGMTGMIGFLSAPVALSVAGVNLMRGEDLRLNTHVLSLTGLLVMLQSSGALANVVSALPM